MCPQNPTNRSVETHCKKRDPQTVPSAPNAASQYVGVDAQPSAIPLAKSPAPRSAAFLYAAPYQYKKNATIPNVGADAANVIQAPLYDNIVQQQSAPKSVATDRLDKRHARNAPAAQMKSAAIVANLLSDVVSQTSARNPVK